MRTSHKLTQFFVACLALVAMASAALAQVTDRIPSDQKSGSVLVFPYYNSNAAGTIDTRLTITNTSLTTNAYIHLFFLQGSTCAPSDMFMCLTPMGQLTMKASDFDPSVQGYLLAVAVDGYTAALGGRNDGGLVRFNNLIGNAFVRDGDYIGNYGAEAFWRYALDANNNPIPGGPELAVPAAVDNTINFNGTEYDFAPNGFWAEIQSPLDATQRITQASLDGNLVTGTLSTGAANLTGTNRVYNADEVLKSFQASGTGGCLRILEINETTIRTAPRLNQHIPAGSGGTILYSTTGGSVGLLQTANRVGQVAAPWSGIRTIHKRAVTAAAVITVPNFIPTC
jgi:hypothetical protein